MILRKVVQYLLNVSQKEAKEDHRMKKMLEMIGLHDATIFLLEHGVYPDRYKKMYLEIIKATRECKKYLEMEIIKDGATWKTQEANS